jgi:hypothetical protein
MYINNISPFMKKHINHPSVIVWTLFNESWGVNGIYGNKVQQQFVDSVYEMAKSIDSTRMIIGNDGWEHTKTDLLTLHDYSFGPEVFTEKYKDLEKKINGSMSFTSAKQNFCKGYHYNEEPILLSEFGGIAYAEEEYDNSWGYGNRLSSKEEVFARISNLFSAVMSVSGISGFCYTQLTDVEQEINGLLDHQHNCKFDPDKIRETLEKQQNFGFTLE